jgi:hypothetical protein
VDVDIRSSINENPGRSTAIAGGLLVVAAVVMWEIFVGASGSPLSAYANKAFFSDDDGKTWFIDDASNLPPFDHDGKKAYRAALFRCGSGKPFIAYLEKYSDAQIKRLAEQRTVDATRTPNQSPGGAPPSDILMDVKRPGDRGWLPAADATDPQKASAYRNVLVPVCPDGSVITVVLPADADGH